MVKRFHARIDLEISSCVHKRANLPFSWSRKFIPRPQTNFLKLQFNTIIPSVLSLVNCSFPSHITLKNVVLVLNWKKLGF
jgi:hypothetical protein